MSWTTPLDVLGAVLGFALIMGIGAGVVAFVTSLLGRPSRQIKLLSGLTALAIGAAIVAFAFWSTSVPPAD